jgi:methionyl aminopeptidase
MNDITLDKAGTGKPVPVHGPEAFEAMRRAGRLAAMTLDHVTPFIKPGVSTGELDERIDAFMRAHGGVPATLGYRGYPKSSCISVNHVVNHGIPDEKKKLKEGDILNIDVTVILDGWYGDTSRMFYVGRKIPVKSRLLTERTFEAMWAGINAVRPGATLDQVSWAIQQVARERRNGVAFSVVEDFVGHGIGRVFHDAPEVKHFRDPVPRPGKQLPDPDKRPPSLVLAPGMIFTIEPMINAGTEEVIISKQDGWTTTTRDKQPSAQFEHTVGVTKDGVEVFTLSPQGLDKPPYDL